MRRLLRWGLNQKLDQGNDGGLTLAGGWKVLAGVVGLALDFAVKWKRYVRDMMFRLFAAVLKIYFKSKLTWIRRSNCGSWSGGWIGGWIGGGWLVSEVILLSGSVVGIAVVGLVFGFSSHGIK